MTWAVGEVREYTLVLCPTCSGPMAPVRATCRRCERRAIQEVLLSADQADFAAYKADLRRRERVSPVEQPIIQDHYSDDHPGYPLGVGMPLGETMRKDGESHRSAWMRITRADPCSYCGGEAGTVDHIVPQARRVRGLHNWTNYTGACQSCNKSKADSSLLSMLLRRAGVALPKTFRA